MEPSDDRFPIGVPIQVIAYKDKPLSTKDVKSPIKVINSRQIRAVAPENTNDEEAFLDVDYVFQNCGEGEIMDRSINSVVSAALEGVNSCILTCGSSSTTKRLFTEGDDSKGVLGISASILEYIFELLSEKERQLNTGGRGRNNTQYSFFLRMSYVEFYEEVITDLLNPSNKHVSVSESESRGVFLKNAQRIGPIRFLDDALDTLRQGRLARSTADNAHGPASLFTSTLLRLDLTQLSASAEQGQATTVSSLFIGNMPHTERLSKPTATIRMAEGPILNKSLHAFDSVVRAISKSQGGDFPPYSDSHLTSLLQQPLGGNCITTALLFVADNDFLGTKATLGIGRMLQGAFNYPVVNNEMMQGLMRRNNSQLLFLKDELLSLSSDREAEAAVGDEENVRKIHDLEGKLIRENLEKLRLREEKEKIVRTVAEFRAKYQSLVESKAELQRTLIETEEDKLRVSKALLDLQIENNGFMEKAEQEKYEIVTKLLNAENDILELEMAEESKTTKIKELEDELAAAVGEKKELAMEFVSLKTNYVNLNGNHKKEVAKNQQLGVELLTLANQKKVLTTSVDDLEHVRQSLQTQQAELRSQIERLGSSEAELKDLLRSEREISENLRSEKARVELELQSAVVSFESKKLELDKNTQDFARERDTEMFSLRKTMENELKRVQMQRENQVEQCKKLETNIRQLERQVAELQTALSRQFEENTTLSSTNARLEEQLQSQEDAYRIKLLRYMEFTKTAEMLQEEKSVVQKDSKDADNAADDNDSKDDKEQDDDKELDDDSKEDRKEDKEEDDDDNDDDNDDDIKSVDEEDEDTRHESSPSEESATTAAVNSEQIDSMRLQLTRELVETYQVKERQNQSSLDTYRRKNHDLLRKNRLLYEKFRQLRYVLEDLSPEGANGTAISLPDLPAESELKAGDVSELEVEIEKELVDLRERMRILQDELSLQQEKNLQAAEGYKAMVVSLEKGNLKLNEAVSSLTNERDKLQNDLNRITKRATGEGEDDENDNTMKQMKEIQETLLQKIQELRDATPPAAPATAPPVVSATVSSARGIALQKENDMLREKLNNARGGGNQASELEDAERRCAELMTRSVMAEQELETYKKYMKTHTAKLTKKIALLEKK